MSNQNQNQRSEWELAMNLQHERQRIDLKLQLLEEKRVRLSDEEKSYREMNERHLQQKQDLLLAFQTSLHKQQQKQLVEQHRLQLEQEEKNLDLLLDHRSRESILLAKQQKQQHLAAEWEAEESLDKPGW